jgi:polyisoprenoid-binding protein YceI
MKIGRLLTSLAVLVVVPIAAHAALNLTGTSKVDFKAVGPGGLSIEGKSADLQVADDGSAVTVTAPLASLDTGIALRNKHMKEKYLEVEKYPEATLKASKAGITFPEEGKSVNGAFPGSLTLHGVTKDANVHYKATRSKGAYQVDATMKVNMNDYGMVTPSYLGVSVDPNVEVEVVFQVNDGP